MSLLEGKLSLFANNIIPVNVDENWEKLKQTIEINLRYIYN